MSVKKSTVHSDNEFATCESKKMHLINTPKPSQAKQLHFQSGHSFFSSSKKEEDEIPRFFNSAKGTELDMFIEVEDTHASKWRSWAQSVKTPQQEKLKYKSAFKLFKLDRIVDVKAKHPDLDFRDRLAYLKDLWKHLSKDEKCIYVQRSRLEKEKAIIKIKEETLLSALKQQ